MPYDLREWIKRIEPMPGHLVRIKKQINPHEFEASTIMRKLQDEGKFPAVIFENTLDLYNNESGIPIMFGAVTNRKRVVKALGLDPNSPPQALYEETAKRTGNPIRYQKVAEKDSPVKELVKRDEECDIGKLPMSYMSEMDPGPYFDMNTISIDPETGRYNISFQRTMYKGPRRLAISITPRHLWYNIHKWGKQGKSAPVAYLLGHNPLVPVSSTAEVGFEVDEYDVAGGWLGEPLRVCPSTTWGDDFLIPADAEIVLEGYMLWDKEKGETVREVEAPFGEFTGYYGPQRLSQVIEVTAINMRKAPILMNVFMWYESNCYVVGNESNMYSACKARVPGTLAVNNMYNLAAIIQMKKTTDGDPKRGAMAVLGADIRCKHVIVVDEDIDPFNMSEVMWAIHSRVQAKRDVEILGGVRGTGLDPSMTEQNITDVMIIDATAPVEKPFHFRIEVPKEVKERMKLEDYISKTDLAQIPFSGYVPYIMP